MITNKNRFNSLTASWMRAATCLSLLLTGLHSAQADVGDRWEGDGVITNNDEYLSCLFEVISEDNREVRFVPRGDGVNTINGRNPKGLSFEDYVRHDGTLYTIVEIGNDAFADIKNLEKVTFMCYHLRRIGNGAFKNCTKLKSFNFSSKITEIGTYAFDQCGELATTNNHAVDDGSFYLPNSLRKIGECAFRDCSKAQFKINQGLESIGMYAFQNCDKLTEVTLPASVKKIDATPFVWSSNLQNIYVDKDNPYFYDIDGVLYCDREGESGTESCLLEFPCGRTGRYDIDDRTNVVCYDAFYGSRLSEVFVPMTVTEIENEAFNDCRSLTNFLVEWTEAFPSVHSGAFDDHTKTITYLCIPSEASGMTADDILNFYKSNGITTRFKGVESYTPISLTGLRIGGYGIPRTCTSCITKGVTSGKVSYDMLNHFLVLTNATIVGSYDTEYGIENYGIDGLTIELNGQNTINTSDAGIWLTAGNILKGPGSLTIVSDQAEGIKLSDATLTIENATLDINSRGGDISGKGEANVNIVNSNLTLRPTGATGVATVRQLTTLNMDNSHISSPLFGRFDSSQGAIVDRKGDICYSYIAIQPGTGYDLYVGTQVTEENKGNITYYGLTSGHVSFDPQTNVLTLDNVDIADNPSILCNNIPGLTVNLVGTNKLLSTEQTVRLLKDMTFTGSGSLQVKAEADVAILIESNNTKLAFENTTMNIYGANGAIIGKNDGAAQMVEVRNANVVMNAAWGEPVVSCIDGFDLYDCYFDNHDQYFDASYRGICNYWEDGDLERIETVETIATGKTEPTDLQSVASTPSTQHPSPIYDLQGRRINGKPQPGVFIQKGKKIIIK